ncbi:MAG: ABC transporter permease [Vicinamibacterales bacterium]
MTLERERWTSVVRPDLALWIEHVLQDVRSGTRVLWTAPAVSLTAVALVALVVGGNTTIYSVVRMMLTNPAAGVTADGLVTVAALRPTSGEPFVSYPDYLDLASADVVERSAAWTTERLTVNVEGVPHAVSAGLVTGAYFDVLAVTAREGRVLTPRDEGPGAEGLVAVVSERWSRDRFGSDRSVVGRRLLVNGQPVTVVGVAAKRFRGALLTPGEDLWMPLVPFHQARHSEGTLGAR